MGGYKVMISVIEEDSGLKKAYSLGIDKNKMSEENINSLCEKVTGIVKHYLKEFMNDSAKGDGIK